MRGNAGSPEKQLCLLTTALNLRTIVPILRALQPAHPQQKFFFFREKKSQTAKTKTNCLVAEKMRENKNVDDLTHLFNGSKFPLLLLQITLRLLTSIHLRIAIKQNETNQQKRKTKERKKGKKKKKGKPKRIRFEEDM